MSFEPQFAVTVLRPVSATQQWITWLGFAAFAATLFFGLRAAMSLPVLFVLLLCAYAVPVVVLEVVVAKRLALGTYGDGWTSRMVSRTLAHYLVFGVMVLLLWALPWYQTNFLEGIYATIDWRYAVGGGLLLMFVTPFYLMLVDHDPSLEGQKPDGALALGEWLSGRRDVVHQNAAIRQFLLGWAVKFFFIPVMLNLSWVSLEEFSSWNWPDGGLAALTRADAMDFIHETGLYLIGFLDVTVALVGYLCTLKLFGSHIRSTDSTALGWLVCVVCYPPLWPVVYESYLAYGDDSYWQDWLGNTPDAVQWLWGGAILLFSAIYVWATVSFGVRFSNLTNRGILTNGPYAFVKHPAYLAKNIVFWLTAVPFVPANGIGEAARLCLLLLLVNGIYYLRAKTEERHLRSDPTYVAYESWIAQSGLWARIKRPLLRYYSTSS
jgi:protein-S-isoprenylcysteine O-methyltransferase Ste14